MSAAPTVAHHVPCERTNAVCTVESGNSDGGLLFVRDSMRDSLQAAALVCMDARLLPERFFGLEEGDIHVIRCAFDRTDQLTLSATIIGERTTQN